MIQTLQGTGGARRQKDSRKSDARQSLFATTLSNIYTRFRALIYFLQILAKMFFPVREKRIARRKVAIVNGVRQEMG